MSQFFNSAHTPSSQASASHSDMTGQPYLCYGFIICLTLYLKGPILILGALPSWSLDTEGEVEAMLTNWTKRLPGRFWRKLRRERRCWRTKLGSFSRSFGALLPKKKLRKRDRRQLDEELDQVNCAKVKYSHY